MGEVLPAVADGVVVELGADERFFALIVGGESPKRAAYLCGFSLNQAYRRLGSEAFQARLSEARQAATAQLALRLGEVLGELTASAVKTLHSVMEDPEAPAGARVAAARAVLSTVVSLTGLEDARQLAGRLGELERVFSSSGSVRPSGAALRGDRL